MKEVKLCLTSVNAMVGRKTLSSKRQAGKEKDDYPSRPKHHNEIVDS